MGGGREPCHVTTGFGDDHLRDLRSDAGNGLQQLDLVLPWARQGGYACHWRRFLLLVDDRLLLLHDLSL